MTRPAALKLAYSLCWEDPAIDLEALRIAPGDTIATIGSAGCNALTLLGSGADRVIAVDYNPLQNALLELKAAAVAALSREEYFAFVGESPSSERPAVYTGRIAPGLGPRARDFWSGHLGWIAEGVHGAGALERHFSRWRTLMRVIQGGGRLARMFESRDFTQRKRFFESEWDRLPYRAIVRLFFNRTVLGFAKHPAHFRYVTEPDIAGNFLAKCRHALVDLDVRSNYFLSRIFLGRYLDTDAVPPFLTRGGYEATRAALGRLTVVTSDMASALDALPAHSVKGFYLSNICEWLPDPDVDRLFRSMTRAAAPGARATLRTLLAMRTLPASQAERWRLLEPLSSDLLARDRSFLYSSYKVLELA